jgi:hypothetical protein
MSCQACLRDQTAPRDGSLAGRAISYGSLRKKFALSALLAVLLLVMLFPVARHMRASSSDDAARIGQ